MYKYCAQKQQVYELLANKYKNSFESQYGLLAQKNKKSENKFAILIKKSILVLLKAVAETIAFPLSFTIKTMSSFIFFQLYICIQKTISRDEKMKMILSKKDIFKKYFSEVAYDSRYSLNGKLNYAVYKTYNFIFNDYCPWEYNLEAFPSDIVEKNWISYEFLYA